MEVILDVLIGYLQSLKQEWQAGDTIGFVQNAAYVVVPLLGLLEAMRRRAKRRYLKVLAEQDEAAAEKELRLTAEKHVRALHKEIAAMEEAGPTGFMRRADIEDRDNNPGRLAQDARVFLDSQSTALHRAFTALAKNEVAEGLAEGTPDFETARLYAPAALSLDPQDRMARMRAEDMAYAKDMAVKGFTITPAEASEDRLEAQDRAAMGVEHANQYFFAARDAGRYRLMLDVADHGERLARAAFGKTAWKTLLFTRHRAEALRYLGQAATAYECLKTLQHSFTAAFGIEDEETLYLRYLIAYCLQDIGRASDALMQFEVLLPDHERVLSVDHPDTLATRSQIASCLRDTGRASDALTQFEALLPEEERVLGVDHPDTLTTRYHIASCLRDTGRASDALTQLESLLLDHERVKGADHPGTMTTRSLIALCLLDLGRVDEAHTVHDGVLEKLRAAGIVGEEHRCIKRAREVEARLAAATAPARPEHQESA